MKIHLMPQRSPEWYEIRVGKITSSCAEAILRERKRGSGPLQIRIDLAQRVVAERLTGQSRDRLPYAPAAIQHGIETESAGFAAYEWDTGILLDRVGFIEHDEIPAGCSPDGVAMSDGRIVGGAEIKCPDTTTHLEYLRAGIIPEEYKPQIIHDLAITGADWWDFVSFDDRLPKHLQFFRRRLDATTVDLVAYELMLRTFNTEVEIEIARLNALVEVMSA